MGYDAASVQGMIVMYLLSDVIPQFLYGRKMVFMNFPELVRQGEKASGEKPLGKHVLGRVVYQHLVRYGPYAFLKFVQIGRPAVFLPVPVTEYEISELEFLLYVFGELYNQCLGILFQEPHTEPCGHFRHVSLGRLQDNGHIRIIFLHEPYQVNACVRLLAFLGIVLVQDKADIGNNPQHIVLVFPVYIDGIFVIRCQKNLGARAFPELPLFFIQGLFQEFSTLFQDKLVEFRQICGIIPH